MSTEPYVSSAVLSRMLAVALATHSKDETRPALTGVQFCFEPGYLRLVATDGCVLSLVETCYKHELTGAALAPGDELKDLVKRWNKGGRIPLALAFDAHMLGFSQYNKLGNPLPIIALGQVRNTDGNVARYPDWQEILLGGLRAVHQVTFDAGLFINQVTALDIRPRQYAQTAATLRFDAKGVGLEMPPMAANGTFRIGIDAGLLARVLRPFKDLAPQLTFRWSEPNRPVLFEYEGPDWRSVTLIMPMSLPKG